MKRSRRSSRTRSAGLASIAVLVALCLLTQASPTMAGFTADVTNSSNRAGTARYFTCAASYTADGDNAVFAYRLDDPGVAIVRRGSSTYEAESAEQSGGAAVAKDRAGYSGTGFVTGYTDAYKGAATVFAVSVQTTDIYTIALRYANGGDGAARTVSFQVDAEPVQQITLPGFVSWEDWSTVYLSAALTEGAHSVALVNGPADTGNVNLDYLQVSPRAAVAVRDTFTGTTGATAQSRNADVGGLWIRRDVSGAKDDAVLTPAGRIRKSSASSYAALYTSSVVPASADYAVSADIATRTRVTDDRVGVVGRMTEVADEGTFYMARYERATGAYVLLRVIKGTWTRLGQYSAPTSTNSTHRLTLDMNGTTIRVLVNGAERIAVTDSGITAAGTAGFGLGFAHTSEHVPTTITDTTGMHLDNVAITYQSVTDWPTARDFSAGGSDGTYRGAKTSGPIATDSGCPRDSGPAWELDGSSSYVTNPTAHTSTNVFTEELWFRTTVAGGHLIGFGDQATGASSKTSRKIYLTNTGRLAFGTAGASDKTLYSTSGVNYADGRWHHVAATLSPAGMVLYVDGSAAASKPSVTSAETMTGHWRIGYDTLSDWPSAPANPYFTGSIRFAAVYSVALSAAQISDHYVSGK